MGYILTGIIVMFCVEFLLSKDKLPNKDFKQQKQFTPKVRSIDLHGYTLEQANHAIEGFIYKSYKLINLYKSYKI